MSTLLRPGDEVPRGPMLLGLVATVIGIVLAFALTWALADCGTALRPDSARFPPMPDEVNRIEAQVFQDETAAERQRRESARRLQTWGWADRVQRRVHVPADVAIDLYLQEQAR